jgi:hypothetical protein
VCEKIGFDKKLNKPFTIYFDTNFYVWLAQVTDEEANRVISKLNELEIRHVLSGKILFELLSGKERNPQDKKLVKRVKNFKIEPFKVSISSSETNKDTDISWDMLLLSGELRNAIAEFLKAICDTETVAQSLLNMTDKKLSKDKEEKLQQNQQPFLSSIGYDEKQSKEENANAFANFASDLISNLSFILPDEQRKKLEEIDFTVEKSPENLLNISKQLLNSLGSEIVEKLEEEKKIVNSSVRLDPRPYNVAVNEASKKEIKNLGNTFRDAGHINLFVTHQNQIDLIQIDSHQKNLVERNKPKHRLVELNLNNHYFSVEKSSNSAENLSKVIEMVINKKQEIYR